MVIAKLHVICGNCGESDMWKFKIDTTGHDVTDTKPEFEPAVYITCGNCSTVHDISDNAEFKGMHTSQTNLDKEI